jgi:2-polyprenyl-3-methyl-5-hydroxy-6-metoxy-1,4-benzoquinol methylase
MSSGFANPRETWDARFAGDDYIFGTAPNVFLASQRARLVAGGRALSVADGEGRNSVWLAQQGMHVTAFDIAPRGVDKARALAQRVGVIVDFHVSAVEDWAWTPEAFDVVAAIFVQFAAPAVRERMFAGMLRTLKPGGWLLLQGYTPRQLEYRTGGPPCAEHLYTPALLRQAFAAHEIVELREHDEVLAEGTQHAGLSALIDCVVRRN